MLKFEKIKVDDIDIYKSFTRNSTELSCENAFVNLILWRPIYKNEIAVDRDILVIKSTSGNKESFRIPFGEDLERGYELICEYCGHIKPRFWATAGERFENFKKRYGDIYEFVPFRDSFDYIYLREDLANLSGKKYHSKRNHISSFSKAYSWSYQRITQSNLEAVRRCADSWYEKNASRMDKHMQTERQGVNFLLSNMDRLGVLGGAIIVDEKVVAFTLGSQISDKVFDIHIEKALGDYAEGYTVINREFAARELSEYKYINREDDMGLEGLRKAKLSYKPKFLIEKYRCI